MAITDEFQVIDTIKKTIGKSSSRVELGIGDDAAVVRSPKGKLVATVDTLVEGVHFDLLYTSPRELGHKALAVNLSDIAAMGASPLYALVSLGLTQELTEHFVEEFYRGIRLLAKKYKVDIIGGNLVQAPQSLVVDVCLIGEARRYFTRSSAEVGDLIMVTGNLGLSAAGLNYLKNYPRETVHRFPEAISAHLTPSPRIEEANKLSTISGVHAVIDISDGFAKELHHICNASRVGAFVEEEKLPVHKETIAVAQFLGTDFRKWVCFGGEDYELLFTASPRALAKIQKALKNKVTIVGVVKEKSYGVQWKPIDHGISTLQPRGWNHFARRHRPKGA